MATWDADAETTHPVDFRLVRDTFVIMFWQSSLLDETVGWLQSHAYHGAHDPAGVHSTNGCASRS
ncbi:hypothetical protein ACFQW6_09975 [Nocardioides sp. GCM10028917]|uniref:hypothetical protein n=1 Tax=Nocardioides sp. GCM10028917 TaxID=3273408 RepID=UPI0036181444